jgi:hypothetical protein
VRLLASSPFPAAFAPDAEDSADLPLTLVFESEPLDEEGIAASPRLAALVHCPTGFDLILCIVYVGVRGDEYKGFPIL